MVAPRPFLPAHGGGEVRCAEIWRRIASETDVRVVFSYRPDERAGAEAMRAVFPGAVGVARNRLGKAAETAGTAARAVVSGLPWGAARLFSLRAARILGDEIGRFRPDCVVAEYVHVAPAFALAGGAARVLHAHNVEADVAARSATLATTAPARFAFREDARRFEALERRAARAVDAVVCVSDPDAQVFRDRYGARQVTVVPHGFDPALLEINPCRAPAVPDLVLFVGALDWRGNVDGVSWFVHRVWPLVRAARPAARFRVVGRRPDPAVRALGSTAGVEVVGEVEDVVPERLAAAVEVVPLRVAGGARVKIPEALALGRAVVSTTAGAEGTPVEAGRDLLVADGAEAFAQAVIACLADPALCRRLGTAGREFAQGRTWDEAADGFLGALATSCRQREAGRRTGVPSDAAPRVAPR